MVYSNNTFDLVLLVISVTVSIFVFTCHLGQGNQMQDGALAPARFGDIILLPAISGVTDTPSQSPDVLGDSDDGDEDDRDDDDPGQSAARAAEIHVREFLQRLHRSRNSNRPHQSVHDSDAHKHSSVVHFRAAEFGKPVLACPGNGSRSVKPKRTGGLASESDFFDSSFAHELVDLSSREDFQMFLCEPLLAASHNCPPDLRLAVSDRFLLLRRPKIPTPTTNGDASPGGGVCNLFDQISMGQSCGAVGVVVESAGPGLGLLEGPSTTDAVVDSAGAIQSRFAIDIPVVTVSPRGAKVWFFSLASRPFLYVCLPPATTHVSVCTSLLLPSCPLTFVLAFDVCVLYHDVG